jgi:undecaprenyl-phosphate 4-deoxy-4-formamido-L-arabinose transferase
MPSLSIVIPVYNAELTLADLHAQLLPTLANITQDFEIILVEDGSLDKSWAIVEALASQDTHTQGIRLSRNYGQHNALLCGIRTACYDITITMDDDLQHPVSELPILLAKLNEGYDVVYGAPQRQQHGLLRDMASRITKLALKGAMGVETASNVSALRAFRTELRAAFVDYRSPTVSIDVLLTWATANFGVVHVRHDPRAAGQSNYTLRKLVTHAFNLLTGFTTLPLQIASYIGFTFALFGLGVLLWVVGRYLMGGSSVPGFPFLASIIAIFSGVQLFALGITGEYLARIHFRTLERPAYVVRKSEVNPVQETQD